MTLTASPTTTAAVDQVVFDDLTATTADTWFTTTDHRRVGSLLLGAVLAVALVGSALSGLLGQKIDAAVGGRLSSSTWMGADQDGGLSFYRLFTAHGMGMIFLVITPLFLALATIAVPAQIGSARMAFPRLQAFVLWGYLAGAALYVASFLIVDGPPAVDVLLGNPVSGAAVANRATDMLLGSLMLLAVVILAASVNVVTTVLTHRRAGLTLEQVRPFTWSAFVTCAITLLTTPVFLAGLFLVAIDQHFGGGLFNGAGGPRIWVHSVWLFSRPDAYLLLLPALGIASDIVSARAGRPLIGGRASKHLLTAFGVLSLAAWTSGGELANAVVQPTSRWQTGLVAIPAALLVLVWLGTMAKGVRPDVSLLFVAGFVIVAGLCAVNVVVAGIRGISDPSAQAAWGVGQTRTLLIGAPLIALLGGIVELSPIAYGRKLLQGLSGLAALAVIGGVVLSGVAVVGLGYQSSFDAANDLLSIVALVGGLLVAAGIALLVLDLLASTFGGRGALVGTDSSEAAPAEVTA
jgi:cytochrome c oxidase subunit 1